MQVACGYSYVDVGGCNSHAPTTQMHMLFYAAVCTPYIDMKHSNGLVGNLLSNPRVFHCIKITGKLFRH